jgi:spermidine/putrescine-binding protein
MAIDALAEPRDAPHPEEAAALIDFLLRPAVAAEATASAGLASAEATALTDNFRALWPVGVYDPKLVPVIEKEWARTRTPEQAEHKPPGKPGSKPASNPANKPPNKPASKPTRTKR